MASKTALVTGATGCLGRHLVEALAEDTSVRALVRESSQTDHLQRAGAEVLRGSLVDDDDLRHAVDGARIVYHLGGVVLDDPNDESDALRRQVQTVNVEGSEQLARRAAAAGVERFVFCSSLRVFGFGSQLLWSEDGPRSEGDLYARSKALAEEAVLRVGRETGLETVVLRPRLIYGNHDRYFLPRIVRHARRRTVVIPDGNGICDVVYVRDCVQALRLAAETPGVGGEIFNVTSGECVTLREVVAEVAHALGHEVRLVSMPRAIPIGVALLAEAGARAVRSRPPLTRAQLGWYMNDHHFSIAKARRQLGYEPSYLLADALREIDLAQFSANGGPK